MFVNIPKTGYVGVGIVKEPAVPVKDFNVTVEGKEIPILDAPLEAHKMGKMWTTSTYVNTLSVSNG